MQWQKVVVLAFCSGTILAAGTIHLKTRTFDTAGLPSEEQGRPGTRWREGVSHYLVQFRAPVSDADRDALAQRGAVITGSVPDNAVMVAAGDDFSTIGLNVEWAGRLHGEDKLSPSLEGMPDGSTFVIEFQPDVDPADAQALLSEQNVTVLAHPNLAGNHFLISGGTQAVLALQDWDEVDYIFPASADLMSGQAVHLCEAALSTDGSNAGQYVVASHGWPKDAAGKVTVGYYFSTLTPAVPAATLKSDILRALTQWTSYAPLQLKPAASATAPQTINVLFASGDHGDGFPFTSDVLAHTFYPSNPEPIAGDMHLNMDEAWHSGNNIDVYTVALHEAGHALGLGHSDLPGAIMYPYYRLGAQISSADITGVQAIYGAPSAPAAVANPLTLTVSSVAAPITAAAVSISGTTANGIGTTVVTWQTDQKATGQAVGAASWTAASIPLVVGVNTIAFTVTDGNHRQTTQSVTVTRSAPAPAPATPTTANAPAAGQTPPVLTITAPAMTIVQTSQPVLTVTGAAGATAAKVTWQNGPEGTGLAAGTASWTANVPLLTGTNNVVLRVFDAAGNSSWRSITVVRR